MLERIPPGHSIAAHTVLGWCATCPARGSTAEADAWRAWAGEHVPEARRAIRERLAAQ